MKYCNQCQITKDESEFYINPRNGQPRGMCKKCMNQRKLDNARRRANGDADYRLKHKYGITHNQYMEWMDKTTNCPMCDAPISHRVTTRSNGRFKVLDHDHKTGKIRGVLCNKCNLALGLVDDNPEVLARMIAYLEQHK